MGPRAGPEMKMGKTRPSAQYYVLKRCGFAQTVAACHGRVRVKIPWSRATGPDLDSG